MKPHSKNNLHFTHPHPLKVRTKTNQKKPKNSSSSQSMFFFPSKRLELVWSFHKTQERTTWPILKPMVRFSGVPTGTKNCRYSNELWWEQEHRCGPFRRACRGSWKAKFEQPATLLESNFGTCGIGILADQKPIKCAHSHGPKTSAREQHGSNSSSQKELHREKSGCFQKIGEPQKWMVYDGKPY